VTDTDADERTRPRSAGRGAPGSERRREHPVTAGRATGLSLLIVVGVMVVAGWPLLRSPQVPNRRP